MYNIILLFVTKVLRMVQYGALTFCTVIVTISHTPEGVDREIKVRHRADILLLLAGLSFSNDTKNNYKFCEYVKFVVISWKSDIFAMTA